MDKKIELICIFLLLASCASPTATPAPTLISPVPSPTAASTVSLTSSDYYTEARQIMVDVFVEGGGVKDKRVLEAMIKVPRHRFVGEDLAGFAYRDSPLPIGYGQTISAPDIVGKMTELLELKEGQKVLEIGTGSGYQAALLAELGGTEVYSIEIVPELAERARLLLQNLGYGRIHLEQGDGYYGWPENAPFDAIIVTAAPDHLPAPLAKQLKDGGRMVIPIGPPGGYQTLWKFVKEKDKIKAYDMGGCIFVPFTGQGIQQEAAGTPSP